ncbi:hypothetical protein U9M48_006931 [Paspalum notatum var. saurae]|uniref:Uncharacterized protein n=1 Tax=Paspalum notatum var. saurae TaxID=547442 RepID=A0AAQ3PZN0_PASNO
MVAHDLLRLMFYVVGTNYGATDHEENPSSQLLVPFPQQNCHEPSEMSLNAALQSMIANPQPEMVPPTAGHGSVDDSVWSPPTTFLAVALQL